MYMYMYKEIDNLQSSSARWSSLKTVGGDQEKLSKIESMAKKVLKKVTQETVQHIP